jgi:hypothetical protein
MSEWTQPLCEACWAALMGDRMPVRMKEDYREAEMCALCKTVTRSGIYARLDPGTLPQ